MDTPPTDANTIFLDNGFFRKLIHKKTGEAFNDGLRESADKHPDLKAHLSPIRPWRTAFGFMEWIGLNAEELPTPPPFDLTSPITDSTLLEAWSHYRSHYDTCSQLDQDEVSKLVAKQDLWILDSARELWNTAIAGTENPGDWLHFALAFDAVHKLVPPASLSDEYHFALIGAGFFGIQREVRNLSKFRLAKRLWDRSWNKMSKETPADPLMIAASQAMSIKNQADYLDGDLIHVATLGVEDHHGTDHKIICLTCDEPDQLIVRLGVYRGLLSYARKLYDKGATALGSPPDYDSYLNGVVYCFDHAARLVRKIDIESDTETLHFLGDEPKVVDADCQEPDVETDSES